MIVFAVVLAHTHTCHKFIDCLVAYNCDRFQSFSPNFHIKTFLVAIITHYFCWAGHVVDWWWELCTKLQRNFWQELIPYCY